MPYVQVDGGQESFEKYLCRKERKKKSSMILMPKKRSATKSSHQKALKHNNPLMNGYGINSEEREKYSPRKIIISKW